MNNNEINFDPNTGQAISTNVTNDNAVQQQSTIEQPTQNMQNINQPNNMEIQQQMQAIPTVDQNQQVFLNNSQVNTAEKNEKEKDGNNIAILVVIFIVILAAIFFLFPYLIKFAL